MDPLLLSLIMIAGLIVLAATMTVLAVTGSSRSLITAEEERARPEIAVPVSIFCPKHAKSASVRLGTGRQNRGPALTVFQCEFFDGPVTCDMACLTASAAA